MLRVLHAELQGKCSTGNAETDEQRSGLQARTCPNELEAKKLPASRTQGGSPLQQTLVSTPWFCAQCRRRMEHKEYRHLRQIDDINKIYVVGKKLGRY